jgi:hypothetical protein
MFIPLKMVLIGIDPYPYKFKWMVDLVTPPWHSVETLQRPSNGTAPSFFT